MLKCKYIIF